MLKKLWIMIAGLIVIFAGGAAVHLWLQSWSATPAPSPSPSSSPAPAESPAATDEFADWNSFTNPAGGYSFKYPREWSARIDKYNARNASFGSGAIDEVGLGGVEVYEFSGEVNEYIKWREQNVGNGSFENPRAVSVAGISGVRFDYADTTSGSAVLVKANNKIFSVFLNSTSTVDQKMFEGVLRNFSFTEAVKTDVPGRFTLPSGLSVPLDRGWELLSSTFNPELTVYDLATPHGRVQFNVVNVTNWLQGPNFDVGYVLNHTERPAVLEVIKNIFAHQKITGADKKAFEENAGEFLGYSLKYRVGLNYLANTDNSFRGISFFNLTGQSVGVSPVYYVVLYNPERDLLVYGYYSVADSFKEVAEVNKPLIGWDKAVGLDVTALDRAAHEKFKKIVEGTSRADLSFGDALEVVDNFFKSIL